VASAKAKLEKSLGGDAFPLDYSTSMRVIRDALAAVSPAPVVVSEGANTMDNARYLPPPPLLLCFCSVSAPPTTALFLDQSGPFPTALLLSAAASLLLPLPC